MKQPNLAMVLGMKSKHKKASSITVDYVVHVEEIRPWHPSESSKSVQTVLLHWESGNRVSGSFLSVAGDSSIVINESFMLPVTLHKDKKGSDKFKKNYLEFSLFEQRKDKAKGQLMGTASLNLADYGLFDDAIRVNTLMSFKKSSKSSVQPAIFIGLEMVEKESSSTNHGLSEESGSEFASFTDDDSSSHSSRAAGSSIIDSGTASSSQNDKLKCRTDMEMQLNNSSPSSNDSFLGARSHMNDYVSSSKFSERSLTSIRNSANPSIRSSPSSISFREILIRQNESNKARSKHLKSVHVHGSLKESDPAAELSGSKTHQRIDSSCMGRGDTASTDEFDNWEDVLTFIIALEKVESWLFSRIVESLWWQTFTPHMQPCVAEKGDQVNSTGVKKMNRRKTILSNHEHGNFSMELWKKAFKDACERLCPIRAGGHQCGCLSVLVRLVMEQLVNRLDIAMFNAILRESPEEIPTDPLSDPITDSKVLPIPAGKSSFGSGAQLKNAIGNWSRWLTDLSSIEEDSCEDTNILGDGKRPKSFKAFTLLHSLSDLMMLPFRMIADASTRREVCPAFGPTIVKRVLNNFIPDEFCPECIPRNIIDGLDSEDTSEGSGYLVTTFPCNATPLTSIIPDSFLSSSALAKLSLMPKDKGGRSVVRYQLFRENMERW